MFIEPETLDRSSPFMGEREHPALIKRPITCSRAIHKKTCAALRLNTIGLALH
jgi:hypothetical protein